MRAVVAPLFVVLLNLLCGCGTTDQDRIDVMIKDVTGELSRARVEHALAQYVDLPRQSLSVRVMDGDTRIYVAEDAAAFAAEADRRLSFLYGKSVSVLRRQVHIAGGEALVDLQLFGRDGMVNVHYGLVKRRPERWLLFEVSITR